MSGGTLSGNSIRGTLSWSPTAPAFVSAINYYDTASTGIATDGGGGYFQKLGTSCAASYSNASTSGGKTVSFSGSTTTTGIKAGMGINGSSGLGIPTGASVTQVNSTTQITLNVSTGTGSGSVVVGGDGGSVVMDSTSYVSPNCFQRTNLNSSVAQFGAKCDGQADDSVAFMSALQPDNVSAPSNVSVPSGVKCVVENLVLDQGQTLNCNGSTLQLGPTNSGATNSSFYLIELEDSHNVLKNCVITDRQPYGGVTTTLASAPTSNSTCPTGTCQFTVNSATGFYVGNPITISLDSNNVTGYSSGSFTTQPTLFPSVITSVTGTTITI